MNQKQQVLIIGYVWPEPKSSAAGTRMIQLISLFQEQGWQITFASPAMDSDFMFDLSTIGVEKKSITLNASSFDVFIQELNPSIVLFDRFMMEEQFGWRVAEHCPNALRILDTEDLHSLRLARQLAVKENRSFERADLFSDAAKREVASILRCDMTLIISEFEMELLQKEFKVDSTLLYYLPIWIDSIVLDEFNNLPDFHTRKDFVFMGNFLHEPNWDATLYLKKTIWPLIRKRIPSANMNIYGAYPSQKVLQLHQSKEHFIIKGRVDDIQEVVRNSRIVLAPIRFGAGIKGKLLEAMQCGTPSITTSIGAESMHGELPWNGFIADDPEQIADYAVQLYEDELRWEEAQMKGKTIIEHRYLKGIVTVGLIDRIYKIQQELKEHRMNNFIGSMLHFHQMRSTEFMSRWIELKNKSI
ncbi:glycosyltransferase [Flavobacterium sp. '19STA2R22 D10 B1']|uniref:glycosyltransferase n=1 Tax=Flavobacterium aerium TaxID=3037261 RepID=UPI00278C1B20|nr:glycosyltransferase [Flavobacterium sp. '19STA2R22 D10 B1']